MTIAFRDFSTAAPLTPEQKLRSERAFYYRAVDKGFKKRLFSRAERDFLRKEIGLWFHHRNGSGVLHYAIEYFTKALRMSERTARRIRKWCIERGFVRIKGYAKGGRSRAVHYVVDLDAISNFVSPPPFALPGDLSDVGGYGVDSAESPDFDEFGMPIQDASDMAPEGYCDGKIGFRDKSHHDLDLSCENNEYHVVRCGEKPCQNGRRYKGAPHNQFPLQGVNPPDRPSKSSWPLHSPIRLFGPQGMTASDIGTISPDPKSFPIPEGPYGVEDAPLKSLRKRNNTYAVAKDGEYA